MLLLNENKTEHNLKQPYIPDYPYRILIIGGSGLRKSNALLNLTNNQLDIDKIYSYVKDAKHQFSITKRKQLGLKYYDDPKAFFEDSNDMQDAYKNIEEYNPGKKRKILIVFDDMTANMINNKKLNPTVTEIFIRGRKFNISIFLSHNQVPKDVTKFYGFFILKIPNKRELQQIAVNHSSDIDFKDFMKIYIKCAAENYSFLVNGTI